MFVSTLTGYGLVGWGLIPGRGRDFYFGHHLHTVSGAYPAFYPVATGLFHRSKAAGAWNLFISI